MSQPSTTRGPSANHQFRIASWNIGAGLTHKEYASVSSEYIAGILNEIQPDAVCLQEALFPYNTDYTQAKYLAGLLAKSYVAEWALDKTHLNPQAAAGLAILSRWPIKNIHRCTLPNPNLSSTAKDGATLLSHEKGILSAHIEWKTHNINLLCGHFLPIHIFGLSPQDPKLDQVKRAFANFLTEQPEMPMIAGIDFGATYSSELLPADYNLSFSSLIEGATRPDGRQTDHILASEHWRVTCVNVVPTEADHHLCVADIQIIGRN